MTRLRVKPILPLLVAAVALAVIAVYLLDLRRASKDSAGGAEDEAGSKASVEVVTAPLVRGSFTETVRAYGQVTAGPGGALAVSASYDCRVKEVRVRTGQAVRPGDVLFLLDESPDGRLALDQARIAEQAALTARDQTRRLHDLKLVDNREMSRAEESYNTARAQLASFEVRRAEVRSGVRAPTGGVVTWMETSSGALVAAGAILCDIARGSGEEVQLGVEPADCADLSPGDTAQVRGLDRRSRGTIPAVVRAISPSIDASTRLCDVYAALPPGAGLVLGQPVEADLPVSRGQGLLVAPSAVLPESDGEALFTVGEGRAHRHLVTVLRRSEERVQLAQDSLHAGDEAVILGNYELQDGDSVRVQSRPGRDSLPVQRGQERDSVRVQSGR